MKNERNDQRGSRLERLSVWVKANDGTTYICPKSAVQDHEDVQFHHCMDESMNPQNN